MYFARINRNEFPSIPLDGCGVYWITSRCLNWPQGSVCHRNIRPPPAFWTPPSHLTRGLLKHWRINPFINPFPSWEFCTSLPEVVGKMSFLLPHGVCSSKKSLHFQAQQAEVVLIGMKALLLSMPCWRTIGIEFSHGPLTLWRSSTGRRRNESLGWRVTPCCFFVQIELYGAPLHHKVNQPPLGANDFKSFQISR